MGEQESTNLAPDEQLEKDKRIALSIANRRKRMRYLDLDQNSYTMRDGIPGQRQPLCDDNDPLLEALRAGKR